MNIDMTIYKEEDIKDRACIAYLNGYMGAYNDVNSALEMYRENVLSDIPSETMRNTADEICASFAEYVKQYINEQRAISLVHIIDQQKAEEAQNDK